MAKEKNVTILEIARMAGVNPSTVSRVLNHPEVVSEETRDRVLGLIQEYNYKPNPFARGLQTRKSRIVALVVPNFTNLSFANLARGVQERLQSHDYSMVIFSSHESSDWEKKICREISNLHIDGVIFASSSSHMPHHEELSEDTAKLFIERDGSSVGIDSLLLDMEGAFGKLIHHLSGHGHSRIALVAGDTGSYSGMEKIRCFRKAMDQAGHSVPEGRIANALWSSREGWSAAEDLLSQAEPPTAIISATDSIALGIIGAAASLGFRIPEDISIASFNDEPGSESMNPPLTTMGYDDYGMGQDAAGIILNRIRHPDAEMVQSLYPMHLVERKTTGALKPK